MIQCEKAQAFVLIHIMIDLTAPGAPLCTVKREAPFAMPDIDKFLKLTHEVVCDVVYTETYAQHLVENL